MTPTPLYAPRRLDVTTAERALPTWEAGFPRPLVDLSRLARFDPFGLLHDEDRLWDRLLDHRSVTVPRTSHCAPHEPLPSARPPIEPAPCPDLAVCPSSRFPGLRAVHSEPDAAQPRRASPLRVADVLRG